MSADDDGRDGATLAERPGSREKHPGGGKLASDSSTTRVERPSDAKRPGSRELRNAETAVDGPPDRPSRRPRGITDDGTLADEIYRAADLHVVDPGVYEFLDEFARGGLGRIVRARDRRTGRIVAIKEMLATSSEEIEQRFTREAKVTANLQHPSIVPVYEIGKWPSGEPFYAMQFVGGRSLEKMLDDMSTLAMRLTALPTVVAVADALAYAHGQRVIHRDLKPANILCGEFGETVVVDWGLAKVLDPEVVTDEPVTDASTDASLSLIPVHDKTIAGTVLGTPYYMPPEQAMGKNVDERADVFAIGAILYHLITGVPPFEDRDPKNLEELAGYMSAGHLTPITNYAPDAPPDLITIVTTAMQPDPTRRYRSARELADELRRFTSGQLVRTHRYDRRTLFRRWVRRNRAPVIVGLALFTLIVAGSIASVARILTERDSAKHERETAIAARGDADLQAQKARESLATALYQKGRSAEVEHRWALAAMYYAGARVQHDTPEARWAAGLAEARAIVPHVRYLGHAAAIRDGAFAPDGERAVTVDAAGSVRVWSPANGALIAEATLATSIHSVAFAPDGNELAIGKDDGTIARLTPNLAPIAELPGHTGAVHALAYSPDGKQLASGGIDKMVRMWTLATGESRVLAGHAQVVMSVAFTPDGKQLASGSDDRRLRLWDVATGSGIERGTHVSGGINAVGVSKSGDIVMSAGWDFGVNLWYRGGQPVGWFDEHSIHAAAFSPDDRVLATAGDSGKVHIWEVSTQKLIARLDAPGRTTTLAFSADGNWLLTGGVTKRAIVWNVSALPRLIDAVGHRTNPIGIAFSRDGSQFVTGSDDLTIRIWDAATGAERTRISLPSVSCINPKLLPNGDVIACCEDATIRRWSQKGIEVARLSSGLWRRFSSLSPDGKTLAVGHMRGQVALVDLAAWKIVVDKKLHEHQLYAVAYTPSGQLVTGGLDGRVLVSTPALEPVREVASKTEGVFGAMTDAAGTHVVAGSQDGIFEAWDIATGTLLKRDQAHESAIWSLIYAPDGKRIYTASEDGTVKIWEPSTWRLLGTLDPQDGALAALGLSPDGRTLVAGSRAGGLVIWDVPSGTPRRRIGGRARDHGSCQDVTTQTWVDDTHREIVHTACQTDAATYYKRYGEHSHQRMTGDVDVVSDWSE